MKLVMIIITALIMAMVVYLFVLGKNSRSGTAEGVLNGKLHRCPDTPNCVCSEFTDDNNHYVQPISMDGISADAALNTLKDIIIEMNGKITSEGDTYVSAIFTSSFFGFVDDFELRLDLEQNVIHLRSASRVGRGDLGVNRKRVERITRLFHDKMIAD